MCLLNVKTTLIVPYKFVFLYSATAAPEVSSSMKIKPFSAVTEYNI